MFLIYKHLWQAHRGAMNSTSGKLIVAIIDWNYCCWYVFQEIAKRYPDIPLSTVLIAEKKFVEADLDRNGVSQTFVM